MIASDYLESVVRPVRRAARFWWVALGAFGVVMAATLAASVLGRQYRSEAVVYYQEGMQWTTSEGLSTRRIGNRLKDVLLARAQLARIVEELGLYPELVQAGRMAEAVEEMRLATGFKVSEGDIFVVSYTGGSPQEAQRVTAKLTDVLIDQNARLRSEQAEIAREFLDAEKKRNAAELGAKETELLRFLAKHPEFAHEQGTMGSALRATARRGWETSGPRAGKGDDALGALRREEERLRRQIQSPSHIPPAPKDPALVAAKNEAEANLKAAERELASRRARFTEQHPDVRSAAALVKTAGDAYQRALEALEAAERVEVEPRPVLEERLGQVRQEIAAHQRKVGQERASPPRPADGDNAAQRIVALETEWARLNREVAEARERFQQLDTRQFMASMVASTMVSGQAAQIVVIDPAYVPAHPVGMARTRMFLMGLAMALVLGGGLAMLCGALDDRIHDRADLERLGLAPVLIELPERAMRTAQGGEARARAVARDAPGERTGLEKVQGPPEALQDARHDERQIEMLQSRTAATASASSAPETEAGSGRASEPTSASIDSRLVMLGAPDSTAAASFRVLCHHLAGLGGPKTVLVVSPGAEEGKTLCAANLALALGESRRVRVLLLEANLRRPTLARLLGLRRPAHAGEQLELHRARPIRPWVVVESVAPSLHVAAVEPNGEPRPRIDGPALARGIEVLRAAAYDHIVIDGPAILGSADANLLEESVDGILLATWAGRSRGRALRSAVEQVGKGKLLGIALLGT